MNYLLNQASIHLLEVAPKQYLRCALLTGLLLVLFARRGTGCVGKRVLGCLSVEPETEVDSFPSSTRYLTCNRFSIARHQLTSTGSHWHKGAREAFHDAEFYGYAFEKKEKREGEARRHHQRRSISPQ